MVKEMAIHSSVLTWRIPGPRAWCATIYWFAQSRTRLPWLSSSSRLQQYTNQELSEVQVGFRRGRGTRDQVANICWIIEKARESQKKIFISASLTMVKPLTVWVMANWKILKRWECQTTLPVFWETCMHVKKQQLEPDIEQQTGSKLGKEYVKTIYCHSAYLPSIQSTSCEMLG